MGTSIHRHAAPRGAVAPDHGRGGPAASAAADPNGLGVALLVFVFFKAPGPPGREARERESCVHLRPLRAALRPGHRDELRRHRGGRGVRVGGGPRGVYLVVCGPAGQVRRGGPEPGEAGARGRHRRGGGRGLARGPARTLGPLRRGGHHRPRAQPLPQGGRAQGQGGGAPRRVPAHPGTPHGGPRPRGPGAGGCLLLRRRPVVARTARPGLPVPRPAGLRGPQPPRFGGGAWCVQDPGHHAGRRRGRGLRQGGQAPRPRPVEGRWPRGRGARPLRGRGGPRVPGSPEEFEGQGQELRL